MSAYNMMKQLYISAFDMELYISPDHWHEIMTRTWPEYMPVPLSDEDNHPCSLTHIFSDQHPAAYYSFKWSEMIAADIIEEFKEADFTNEEKVAEKGKR
jgi:oligopeptidase A